MYTYLYIICNLKYNRHYSNDKKYTLSSQKKKKGRPKGRIFNEIIQIRVDKETKKLLQKIAEKRNKTLSELIRKTLIKLAKEEK